MVVLTGRAKRPTGASSIGPRPGTTVSWRLATPIANLAAQAEELGWPILGIVGNIAHLRKHGDHTPWSKGKKPGVIYGGDFKPPDPFEAWYVATARSDYDTSWVDFININGRQYNNAGQKVANSSDEHLHVSVALGHENTTVTLFTDYAGGGEDIVDAKTIEAIADAVWSHTISTKSFDEGAGHGAHEGVVNAIAAARDAKSAKADAKAAKDGIAALTERLDTGGGALSDAQLDALATRVADRLGALRFDAGAT